MATAVHPDRIAAVTPASAAPAASPAAARPNPSKVRLAALMLVAVYPLITTLLYIILPLTEGWPTWGRTLVLAPLMVITIVFFIAPRLQRHLGWFIARMPRPRR